MRFGRSASDTGLLETWAATISAVNPRTSAAGVSSAIWRIFPIPALQLYCDGQPFRNAAPRFPGHVPLEFLHTKEISGDRELDITAETCPMTFVRTRLALDRMASGQTLLLRLRGEEPRRNIPRTATEQGHMVIAERETADGTVLLLLRKG
ncbi:sulfurtransferase TusA family protein [Siccirubricoccus deserti]|uniref:Sulfurtransferase TusA family protein n=1 Tax=Siccirubricoccus deserti TaxID=2013562 RepID=A0A9X0QWI2_9PROT|nr:sulfurtransferase TusA family protein [Siccirubricoccus deserti]